MNLDFTNLRKITGGDTLMESELFQVFLDSAKECLGLLLEAYLSGDDLAWRGHAHAFKGISFAIGAEELGSLCKEAQENYQAPSGRKGQMLTAINQAFADVEQQLKKCHSGS